MRRPRPTSLPAPFLGHVWLPADAVTDHDVGRSPFLLSIVQGGGLDIRFDRAITIIARENGARQSTLREAITTLAGFSEHGSPQGMAAVGRIAAGAEYAGGLGR